jgi:hypothetical protein
MAKRDVSPEFTPDEENTNRGTERGLGFLERSIEEFGAARPVVADADNIIRAGNKTFQVCQEKGIPIKVVETDGNTLIVLKRTDLRGDRAKEYGLLDNRIAQVDLQYDQDVLKALEEDGVDLKKYWFEDELDRLLSNTPDVQVKSVKVSLLKPHPRNYRNHPEDQIVHLMKSIQKHGFYRNIVVANDMTVLIGHGVVEAAKRLQFDRVPAVVMDIGPDDPRALRVMTSENEIRNLAEVDDRALTDLLKEIMADGGLEGVGYDEDQLAALLMVTRPMSEVKDKNEASQWVGMPEVGEVGKILTLTLNFKNDEDREELVARLGLSKMKKFENTSRAWSAWWPPRDKDDTGSVEFVDTESDE